MNDAQPATAPRFHKPAWVAADIGVSVSTVYEMLRAGELPRIRVRGQWRIPADRYERWVNGEEDLSRQRPQVVPLRRRTVGGHA